MHLLIPHCFAGMGQVSWIHLVPLSRVAAALDLSSSNQCTLYDAARFRRKYCVSAVAQMMAIFDGDRANGPLMSEDVPSPTDETRKALKFWVGVIATALPTIVEDLHGMQFLRAPNACPPGTLREEVTSTVKACVLGPTMLQPVMSVTQSRGRQAIEVTAEYAVGVFAESTFASTYDDDKVRTSLVALTAWPEAQEWIGHSNRETRKRRGDKVSSAGVAEVRAPTGVDCASDSGSQ
ncbi:hypothetical protein OBBRIDRAFT_829749 [Obba rivulosa]|uniref:Uncharacterized protein n=1 Tax=Obba rivulosa TaxID=1052685 RepID=A0A8E2AKZ4_9APHY|nr:hypothetical protein OBBRIDRAFT_829749 [Obba rivulosa]